jgi:CBS domain-containing protein
MVAIGHDALVKRLLEGAEAEIGPPPCPYAWLVLGSQGRLEQTLRTDQDNAIAYANDAPPSAADYFHLLAERVVNQLVVCGFPRCPGDIMATNPTWCQPLQVWRSYFDRWISVPDEDALLWAATFFDYRKVHGELDVDPDLHAVIGRGKGQRIFLGRMARAALRQSPPLGFFRDFVLESDGTRHDLIDLKARGTALVVDLARIYALDAGSTETNTLGRLRAAADTNVLSASSAEELSAAFELINLFRLRHQYHQVEAGEEPTNLLSVSSLSKLEQRDLKDALRTLSTNQRIVEHSFQVGLFA